MIVRNTTAGAITRPEDISWPAKQTDNTAALDGSYDLIAGAVVDLAGFNTESDINSSSGLAALISSGDLVRVVNGVDVPSSIPIGVRDGWADYNNAGSSIAVTAGVWTTLTNDGAGPYTNTDYLPPGVSQLLNTASGAIDFSDLALGDEIEIRQDVTVNPSINGAQVEIRIQLGTGAATYYLTHSTAVLNQGGGIDYDLIQFLRVYVGDTNTQANPGIVQIRCTEDAIVTNKGSYITAKRRVQ